MAATQDLPGKIRSEDQVAWGANIKGTPRMAAKKVREDLKTLREAGSVGVVQEFKHDYYWRIASGVFIKFFNKKWNTSPSAVRAFAHPVAGAQAVFWNRRIWKKITTRKLLLHRGAAGISEDRYLRAVLLEDRATGLRCWFGTTHFVVGGDRENDSKVRRNMLSGNIEKLDKFLRELEKSGYPIWFQLDANIGLHSAAYRPFKEMLDRHNATIHGEHGVEYTFTINSYESKIVVTRAFRINTKAHGGKMNTDHEVRLTRFHLAEK